MRVVAETLILDGCTMSRQSVIQVHCDRCSRVEHVPTSSEGGDVPDFEGTFLGEHVVYQDLCSGCKEIIRRHWGAFSEKISKSSPIRKKTGRSA